MLADGGDPTVGDTPRRTAGYVLTTAARGRATVPCRSAVPACEPPGRAVTVGEREPAVLMEPGMRNIGMPGRITSREAACCSDSNAA
jgi:hypothetical protein